MRNQPGTVDAHPRPVADDDGTAVAVWPISPLALAALVDLGVPDDALASYFRISAEAARALRSDMFPD